MRRVYTDRLLTLLTVVLMLAMFVFAPLQAVGIFVFQGFAIAALLAIIGSMFVISNHPAALAVMFICLTANIIVFLLRLYYPPWPYNLYVLATAWLAISVTLGAVVTQAVFRRGRVTYHRIVGAILLYLLIAVFFGTLFIFVGLSIPDAIKGITFEDNAALANSVLYLSFVTLTSTGYGDIVPMIRSHALCASSKASSVNLSGNVACEDRDPRNASGQRLRTHRSWDGAREFGETDFSVHAGQQEAFVRRTCQGASPPRAGCRIAGGLLPDAVNRAVSVHRRAHLVFQCAHERRPQADHPAYDADLFFTHQTG